MMRKSVSFVLLALGLTLCSSFKQQRWLSMSTTSSSSSSNLFWRDGLKFGCTACGRCCQNDGEVWLDTDEFAELVLHLKKPAKQVLSEYCDLAMNGWVKVKNQPRLVGDNENGLDDRCIFLGEDGKQCSIYEARPVQCRTYPFWPRLIGNQLEWEKESVVPDSAPGRHWSPSGGGCEGINAVDAPTISAKVIHRNHEFYRLYNDAYPFMTTGDDENRLLAKVRVVNGVVNATKAWVDRFVLQYNLCPFAEAVFVSNKIRYRVFLGTDKGKIIDRIRYEMLALLTSKESDVATTLLMMPFALRSFEDFHDFSLDLEDLVLPNIEKSMQGPQASPSLSSPSSSSSKTMGFTATKRKSLLQRVKAPTSSSVSGDGTPGPGDMASGVSGGCPVHSNSASNNSNNNENMQSSQPLAESTASTGARGEGEPDIQLAFFHPDFQWSDTEQHDPLNFEKRAPFPTINLLRAARVREYANEQKTSKIAKANVNALEQAGSEVLLDQFREFLMLAVEDGES